MKRSIRSGLCGLLASAPLAVGGLACGGSTSEGRTTLPTNANDEPAVAELVPAVVVAEAPSVPATRTVLIDGVRSAVVLDELGGYRLVGGVGTIALVGPDGHVRAHHRLAFGSDGASGVFATPVHDGAPTQAIVGNGDNDGFRGPWSGQLSRWQLDTDTMEQLVGLGYAAPLLARVGPAVVVVSPSEGSFYAVTEGAIERREESFDQLGWAPGRPAECYVGDGEQSYLVRANADGTLVVSESNGPVPETSPAPAATAPIVATLGARGLPSVQLAPGGHRLAVGSSSTMALLGPDGVSREMPGAGYLQWSSADVLSVGENVYALAVPTEARRSRLVDRIPYPEDVDGGDAVETGVYYEWNYRAQEAERSGEPVPPLELEPVCVAGRPARCVRARIEGARMAGWEVYDPAHPTRVLAHVDEDRFPPGSGYTLLAPGGRFLRTFDGESVSITPLPRGEAITDIERSRWVELDTGWLYADPDDGGTLRWLPFDGRAAALELEGDEGVTGVSIVDATHALAVTDAHHLLVLALPGLAVERRLDVAAEDDGQRLGCLDGDLVTQSGDVVAEGGCPIPDLPDETLESVQISADRAFWVDTRLGDEAHVHRMSDGAELVVRITTGGVLVAGPGGVFEGSGEVLDHLVVREPGPVRTAPITVGAEARARFERPGLVAAFFSGAPLPTP